MEFVSIRSRLLCREMLDLEGNFLKAHWVSIRSRLLCREMPLDIVLSVVAKAFQSALGCYAERCFTLPQALIARLKFQSALGCYAERCG